MSEKKEMDKTEEKGYYLLTVSRGPFYIAMLVILLPIVLDLAKFNRGFDGKIHIGSLRITPSAFIFVLNSVTSLLIICFSPVIGALSDINNYRKKLIIFLSITFLIITSMSFVLLAKNTWIIAGIIQIATITIFELMNVIFNAFMAETGKTEEDFNRLSSFSTATENASILCFLVFMPLILRTDASRNLITHGNFDYYKSYSSWNLQHGGSLFKCSNEKDHQQLAVPACWTSVRVGSNGLHDLSVSLAPNGPVTFMQETVISKRENDQYSFSSIMYSANPADQINSRMVVKQLNKAGDTLRTDESGYVTLKSRGKFFEHKFLLVDGVQKIIFSIEFLSSSGGVVKIDKIETVMPIDLRQILVLVISAILFTGISICALFLFRDRTNDSNISLGRVIKNSFKDLRHVLSEISGQRKTFLFLLANILWYGGHIILSLLMIVYLEDVHSLGSFYLAMLFILICVSIIAGAMANYFLKRVLNLWSTAIIIYGAWVLIPFLIYFQRLNISFYVNIIFFVISGVCFGVFDSLKFSIYAYIIPRSEEGKYMGLLFLGSRLMDFLCNLFVLLMMKYLQMETVIAMTSIFYGAAFCLILLLVFKRIENEDIHIEDVAVVNKEVNLDN